MGLGEILAGFLSDKLGLTIDVSRKDSPSNKDITKSKALDKSKSKTSTRNVNKSTQITFDKSTTVHNHYNLHLPAPVTQETIEPLRPVVDAYQKGEITFIAEQNKALVKDTLRHEEDPQIKGLIRFFRRILTDQDLILMRTGLYLNYLRQNGKIEEETREWKRIANTHSNRDKRIINLASTGYFQSYFRPVFNQYQDMPKAKYQNAVREKFNDIIDEMPFAIYVHSKMSTAEILNAITDLAERNIKYGVTTEFIYVHATGASARNVLSIIEEIKSIFPRTRVIQNNGTVLIIKVRIKYRVNNLEKPNRA